MSRVLAFFAICCLVLTVAHQSVIATPGGCLAGCEPWLTNTACNTGTTMKLRLLVDASAQNVQNKRQIGLESDTLGFGFCPVVDQLQAFSMATASTWAAGDNYTKQFPIPTNPNPNPDDNTTTAAPSSNSVNLTASRLRIFGAVGLKDSTLIPKDNYDASALIFDPAQTCTDARGQMGYLIANFFVVNFTMTNGAYKLLPTFDQAVQVGFMPTCDETDVCQINPSSPCLGNVTGRKNCAVCVAGSSDADRYNQLTKVSTQVFASYYGTDKNGRRMTSGASNPLNFLALSSTGVFNALKDDINSAYSTVKNQVPGEN